MVTRSTTARKSSAPSRMDMSPILTYSRQAVAHGQSADELSCLDGRLRELECRRAARSGGARGGRCQTTAHLARRSDGARSSATDVCSSSTAPRPLAHRWRAPRLKITKRSPRRSDDSCRATTQERAVDGNEHNNGRGQHMSRRLIRGGIALLAAALFLAPAGIAGAAGNTNDVAKQTAAPAATQSRNFSIPNARARAVFSYHVSSRRLVVVFDTKDAGIAGDHWIVSIQNSSGAVLSGRCGDGSTSHFSGPLSVLAHSGQLQGVGVAVQRRRRLPGRGDAPSPDVSRRRPTSDCST